MARDFSRVATRPALRDTPVGILVAGGVCALSAGLITGLGYGLYVFGLIVIAIVFAIGVRRPWGVVLCVLPIALFPTEAMTIVKIHGISVALLVGGIDALMLVVALATRPGRKVGIAVLIPACVALFGAAEGGVSSTLHHQLGLIIAWLSGAALGTVISAEQKRLAALLWILSPTALLVILETVGLPLWWANATHETAFIALATEQTGSLTRGFGTYGHPIPAGAICASLALLALTSRPRRWQWLTALYALACVATLSKSAFIALAVGLCVAVITSPHERRRRVVAVAIAVCALAVGGVTIPSPVSRALAARATANDSSLRDSTLQVAGNSIDHHLGSLLFGGGFSGATEYFSALGVNTLYETHVSTVVDNEAVSFMYDFGLVPLALVLVGFAWLCWRSSTQEVRRLYLPSLAALASTFAFFDGLTWQNTSFMFFLFMGAAVTPRSPRSVPFGLTQSRRADGTRRHYLGSSAALSRPRAL